MRKSFEKVYYKKKKSKRALKHIRNRKSFAVDCIKKEKKLFFNNFNPPFVTGNKLYWEMVKAFFLETGEVTDHKLNSLKKIKCYKTMI